MLKKICEHTFLADKLGKDSVVVNLGANKGEFTNAVRGVFKCKIYAIEPVPELFASLKDGDGVVKIQGAITAKDEMMTLFIPEDRCATLHLLAPVPAKTIEVQGYTLRRFLSVNGIDTIDLLKVDIEGAELDLFDGFSSDDLRKISQCTVEFHDFLYEELHERVEAAKEKIVSAGFYCIPFSLNNGDVLFVRKDVISFSRYFFLRYFWKYVRGFFRKAKRMIFGVR